MWTSVKAIPMLGKVIQMWAFEGKTHDWMILTDATLGDGESQLWHLNSAQAMSLGSYLNWNEWNITTLLNLSL